LHRSANAQHGTSPPGFLLPCHAAPRPNNPTVEDNCREQAWVLKNSFQGISITKFVRKLLNVRSPQTLEFAEITALVPFSTPTPDFASCLAACFDRAISIANFDKIGCGSQ